MALEEIKYYLPGLYNVRSMAGLDGDSIDAVLS